MRQWIFAVCVLVVAGCQQSPPAYESTYTPPAVTTAGDTAVTPPQAAFIDTFDRPDGPLGDGWDLRGPWAGSFPMPAATDGYIKDGKYTYDGNGIVYASRLFPQTVKRVGAIGRWRDNGPGAETSIALVISANDNLVSDMVHLVASRNVWTLTVRRSSNGDFERVANGTFKPALAMNRDYLFELSADNNTVTVQVPNQAPSVSEVPLDGLVGPYAFWELFYDPKEQRGAGTVFDYDTVWAD